MMITDGIQLPDFRDVHILVIGDVMIDRYISGSVKRISPEAPVPIVAMDHVENRLGGSANVALNLCALGAKVTVLSIIGDDQEGEILVKMMEEVPNLTFEYLTIASRKTTLKTRVMSNNQHLLRIDHEDTADISTEQSISIIERCKTIMANNAIHGVILQDYNKGMLTIENIQPMIALCEKQNIPTFVDPKEKNFFEYKNCTVFKPNKKEILKALGLSQLDFDFIDRQLRIKLSHKITFITLGSEGIYVNDGHQDAKYGTTPRNIADVCGAGDTVISILCLCYIKKMPLHQIARIANTAGGQVCEKPGVVSIERKNLEDELKSYGF
jgi:D-glycero-beta-D-manno-heptose-7-phosphate kinase